MNKRQKNKQIKQICGIPNANRTWRSKTRFNLKRNKRNIEWDKGQLAIQNYFIKKLCRKLNKLKIKLSKITQ